MSIFGDIMSAILGKSAKAETPAAGTQSPPEAPALGTSAAAPSASVPSASATPSASAAPSAAPAQAVDVAAVLDALAKQNKQKLNSAEIDRRSDEAARSRLEPDSAQRFGTMLSIG